MNEDNLDIDTNINENVISVLKLKLESDERLSEDKCTKEDIIEKIVSQVNRRQVLLKTINNLQKKLEVNISRSPQKDNFLRLNVSEETDEWTFGKLLDSITAKEEESHQISNNNETNIKLLKEEMEHKKEFLRELQASFKEMKENAALNSMHSETGEHFSAKDVKELLRKEGKVSETLQEYQLQTIQKRYDLNLALEKKKNLAEGPLDFATYEMMCIETRNNKEIIQTISEEIKNLMKRASNIINVLSHLAQKLYLAQKEKTKAQGEEKKLEIELNEMRDMLFEEKIKYTRMNDESKELQHKFILLQEPQLIEDYKSVKQKNEEAQKELQRLKTVYEEEMKIKNK